MSEIEEKVAEAPATNAAMHWYVVHAYSQYENSVKKTLTERIKRAGLEHKFGQILVPTEEVMEIKDGVKRMTERKFFPGYVLVQMEMDEETWHLVKSTAKVMGFIGGTPDKPAPISDKEAKRILNQVRFSQSSGIEHFLFGQTMVDPELFPGFFFAISRSDGFSEIERCPAGK
jgi:transcription antitermination factor NusG